MRWRWPKTTMALALVLAARDAAAQQPPSDEMPVSVRADRVDLDVQKRTLEASGGVRVDVPPFTLTSEHVALRRVRYGVELDGEGRLAFCPCLGTPLAVRFEDATVGPPDDVIVKSPTFELFGVPFLWLPWFWVRSPARVGLLAPEVSYRGADGVFLGEGVHLPWRTGDAKHGLDLRAGAYLLGGVAVDARLFTEESSTHVRWDRLRGDDGLLVDARGAATSGAQTTAWDVDMLRAARAVRATTDLDAAARPYDRARVESAWRADGWTAAAGVRTSARRGGDLADAGAIGPSAVIATDGAIGEVGTYDALMEGLALRAPEGPPFAPGAAPLSLARARAGSLFAARAGAIGASLAIRAAGDAGSDGARNDVDGLASARARLALPLVRAWGSGVPDDPWVHRIDPRLEASALAARTTDVFAGAFVPAFGAADQRPAARASGGAWTASGGLATSFGRVESRDAFEIDAAAGVAGDVSGAAPLLRARASASAAWAALQGESAHRLAFAGVPAGHAFVLRGRAGAVDALHLDASAAARDGLDPIAARALADAPLEPSSGLFAAAGWTTGARLAVPIGRYVVARAGGDADLTAEKLLDVGGALELRDPCGCLVVRASGAHRIGRDGVDVWLTADLVGWR